MVVILGAGLAGLSAAHHLAEADCVVLEREAHVGGLCRSFREQGFTFDHTGHLMHLRDPEVRAWVEQLLPDGWAQLQRSAWIHSHGALTPYPFQANTAGLPLEVRLECLMGFVESLATRSERAPTVPDAQVVDPRWPFLKVAPPPAADEPTFHDWILRTFGAGFARHFFEPYNTKLWRRDLREVTGDWVSWSIPRPELGDVLRGALTVNEKPFGYNPEFLYPRAGGIDHLPRALADSLAPGVVRTNCEVVALNASAREVQLADGSSERGELILSSLPLHTLARLTSDLPDDLRAELGALDAISIRAINLGVRGAPTSDAQWIYVPDHAHPFHRVGLPAALTPAMAPDGHHSLVAEIAFHASDDPGLDAHRQATHDSLRALDLLTSDHEVVLEHSVDIPTAYVVFDAARRRLLPRLLRFFLEHDVVPMGRYGSWDYLAMEDSLLHGREAARRILQERS
ncbi:MAG: amine oxidase [Planctomycetota bacterium]|nr:MAG: amine oxidase [Planctomycetota bacterium]